MKEEKEQTVIDKTLLYLENYREMERYIKDAVSETSQVPDIGKYNISAEKAFLQSIRECKAETIILFEHLKKALASLKEDAETADAVKQAKEKREQINDNKSKLDFAKTRLRNYAYEIKKKKNIETDFCPTAIYDGGIRTYIRMPKSNKYDLPNGIKPRAKGKFEAQYNHENLGIFDTVEEAAIAHDNKKKEVIIEVANEYKEKIPEKVYNALINWIPDYIDYSEYE